MVMDQTSVCREKKVDVSSTFVENIFRSGLTLVSSDIIKSIKKIVKNLKKINKQKDYFKKNAFLFMSLIFRKRLQSTVHPGIF